MSPSFQVRLASYRLLLACWQQQPGFRLDAQIRQHPFEQPADARWLRSHVYGACRHWWACSALLAQASKTPLDKLDARVRTLLQLGVYWLRFVDAMPDYAALQQIGELAKHGRLPKHLQGYINGVLRHIPPASGLPAVACLPPWLHGQPANLVQVLHQPPTMGIRVRPGYNVQQVVSTLTASGWAVEPGTRPTLLSVSGGTGMLTALDGFAAGQWLIQDASSAEVAFTVNEWFNTLCDTQPAPGVIVDACAGLGMKTLGLADTFPQARIMALEPDAARFKQLQENVARCQLGDRVTAIQTTVQDWTPTQPVDCVLTDVPCSATGTLRRHPEILLRADPLDAALLATQQGILNTILGWRPNVLVYSTCSLLPPENDDQVAWLVRQGLQAHLIKTLSIENNHDGFFIAILSN
jgi:16S rRNA (cytosine967-C5)-methyltransferase